MSKNRKAAAHRPIPKPDPLPYCGAFCRDDGVQMVCTLDPGHDGDHVAHGIDKQELRRWPNTGPAPDVVAIAKRALEWRAMPDTELQLRLGVSRDAISAIRFVLDAIAHP